MLHSDENSYYEIKEDRQMDIKSQNSAPSLLINPNTYSLDSHVILSAKKIIPKGFLLAPGGNSKMHSEINQLKSPYTGDSYENTLEAEYRKVQAYPHWPDPSYGPVFQKKTAEELRDIAKKYELISNAAKVKFPLAGDLLDHYLGGTGIPKRVSLSRDIEILFRESREGSYVTASLGMVYGLGRAENMKVAIDFFRDNPDEKAITIRSPWYPGRPTHSEDITYSLNQFHIGAVSTVTAVRDSKGVLLGVRESSTGVVTDNYDWGCFFCENVSTPLGSLSQLDLHMLPLVRTNDKPPRRAAQPFRVFGFDTLTNSVSFIRIDKAERSRIKLLQLLRPSR